MILSNGKTVKDLSAFEKGLVLDQYFAEAVIRAWDNRTNNAQDPEACTLAEAKELVNDFITASGFDESLLRK